MLNTASHTFSAIFLLAHTNNKYNYAYLRLEGSRCRVAKIGPCRRIAIFDPFAISSHHDNRPRFQGPHKFRTVMGSIRYFSDSILAATLWPCGGSHACFSAERLMRSPGLHRPCRFVNVRRDE